jgi:hypothetical protein
LSRHPGFSKRSHPDTWKKLSQRKVNLFNPIK